MAGEIIDFRRMMATTIDNRKKQYGRQIWRLL